ncbi:MAG TPA: hypothetical protein VLX11_07685, partial [Candidatus Acidoferrales bacterium]|nr:hypothetical protein [Candidatus Acidoferrales bacterium]
LGTAQLISALGSGSVQAAQMNPPFLYYAKKKGFRELLDVGAYIQMPLGGLTASTASIQNRAGELKRIIRSMQVARRMLFQSQEKGVDLIMRTLRVDRETAEISYADYRKTSSGNGVPTREGMEQIVKSLQLLGQFTGRKVAFEEIADPRIAREVAKELGYTVE